MKLPFFSKDEVETSEDIHYINLGSPNHPNNPLYGKPANPYTFTLTHTDGRVMDEQWVREQMAQHADAGIYAADALDDLIANAASQAGASINDQLYGDNGHLHIISRLEGREQDYFNGLRNLGEDILDQLAKVTTLIKAQNA